MKILILSGAEMNPNIGGTERITYALSQKLIERGYTIIFLSIKKSNYNIEYKGIGKQLFLLNSNDICCNENINQVSNIIKENKIDCIFNPALYSDELIKLSSIIRNKMNIPVISELHFSPNYYLKNISNFGFSSIKKTNNIKAFLKLIIFPLRYIAYYIITCKRYRYILNNTDKLVLLSPKLENEIHKFIKTNQKEKIESIPNFLPFDLKYNYSESMEKEKSIIFIGRLDFNQKRPDRLLKIWEDIYYKYPEWKLKFIGEGTFKKDLEVYVKTKGIKNVEFLGFCDPIEEYKKSEILCITSQFEGLPMVILEGAAFGCIPIAFNSFESIYDIIDDKKNGYIIESFNIKKYKEVLCELMEDKLLRSDIRRRTFNINEKFDCNKIVDRWCILFEYLVDRKKEG